MKKKILCTICVRGGSKGVKNKNIRIVNNKPLIYYTINQAKKSKIFEDIVVSTDSKKIQHMVKSMGIKNFFLRPKRLSTSKAPKIPAIRHALNQSEKHYNKKYDYIVDLDATSPLRTIKDIKKAFTKMIKTGSDIIFSVNYSKINPYFNAVEFKKNGTVGPVKNEGYKLKRRQDAPKVYDLNASIYIWKRGTLLKNDTLFTKKSSIYLMPEERGYEIDTENDLKFVSYLLKKNELFRKI